MTVKHDISLSTFDLPAHLRGELEQFCKQLTRRGLLSALRFLNGRTTHRFTGIFRFDGDMLRSAALVDKWNPEVTVGDDVPLSQAYCAHLYSTGEPLQVAHGPTDPRVPWMADSPVVSYCGALICDELGGRWGAVCHFDTASCDSRHSEMPLLIAAGSLIFGAVCEG